MRYVHQCLLGVLLACSTVSVSGQQDVEELLNREINKLIKYETRIDFSKTKGFIVAVIDQDTTFFTNFGSQADNHHLIDRHDIFELGSSSKAISAHLILEAHLRGQLDLYGSLNKQLMDGFRNQHFQELTIADLLRHKSNFPKRPLGFGFSEKDLDNPYSNYSIQDLQKYISGLKKKVVTDHCSYSHTNYALLETLTLFQTYNLDDVANRFFSKLKMNNTSFLDQGSLAAGLTKSGTIAQPWKFKSFRYSEGLKSTAYDLSNYLRFLIGISNNTWQYYIDAKCKTIFNDDFYTSLGWTVIQNEADFDIFALTGNTGGHSSFMAFIRETKTAVIILANGSDGTDQLGLSVLRMINNNWNRKS